MRSLGHFSPYFGFLALLAFLVMATYAIARPASESLFIAEYGSKSLPYVWIAVAGGAVAAVAAYHRFAAHTPLPRLFAGAAAASAVLLGAILLARRLAIPGATFVLYVWKDVYIVVLVEIFWSFANALFPIRTARNTYGLFCLAGSLGGMAGNSGVGVVAKRFGTEAAPWLVIPILLLMTLACFRYRGPEIARSAPNHGEVELRGGFQVLRSSSYLLLLLALIGAVQIAINLIDYEYNQVLERTYPETDARTAVIGWVYFSIDAASISLQLLTGAILKAFGVAATFAAIPVLLATAVAAFAVAPRFETMAAAKIMSKSLDYSLFRASKEILYIPLDYAEKTRGKALVDMLTYRVAKGGASLLLIALTAVGSLSIVTALAFALTGAWAALTIPIIRRYRQRVARSEED